MVEKRSRGRPKGTTMPDGRYLDAVANLMVKDPTLKKTPAISQVVQKNFPEHKWSAAERRFLRKWNDTAEERLQTAEQRVIEERKERHSVSRVNGAGALYPSITGVLEHVARQQAMFKRIDEIMNPPAFRALREQAKMMERMRDIVDPPALRRIREQTERFNKMMRPFGRLGL